MKTLKKYWRLYRDHFGALVLFQLMAFLVGVLLVMLINALVNQDADYAPMGSFLAILLAALFTMFRLDTSRIFLAVSMGQTRRSFLLCDTLLNTVHFLMSILVCRLLYFLELALCARLYPGFENGMPLEKFFSLPVIGLLTAAVIGVGLLFLMLKMRLGQKAFTYTWLSFWILLMLGSRAISAAEDKRASALASLGKGLVRLITALPGTWWLCMGCGLAAIFAVIGVLGLRRVEIRQ